jgi:integrase
MANQSKTSITENSALEHVKKAAFRAELSCTKIVGFHLQRMKTASTWRFRYRDLTNKAKIINLGKYVEGSSNRLEAVKLAKSYREKIDEGTDPIAEIQKQKQHNKAQFIKDQSSTLGAYFDGIYMQYQDRKKDGGKHSLGKIRTNFAYLFDVPMHAITKDMLEEWQAKREQLGNSYETIRRAYGALRTLLRHAVEKEVLTEYPLKTFKLQEPTHEEKKKKHDGSQKKNRRMLTDNELAKIRSGAEMFRLECEEKIASGYPKVPIWFYYFFRLAAYTGMRPGDLYSLNWIELNLNFKNINFTPNKTLHHRDPIQVNIILDDSILELIKAWHAKQGKPTSGLVFPNPITGEEYKEQAHRRHWKRLLELGGIDGRLDFYSLRHHFISKMVDAGVPIFTVARLAGHKSTNMIEEHYAHLKPNASVNPLALVSGDFNEPAKDVKHG